MELPPYHQQRNQRKKRATNALVQVGQTKTKTSGKMLWMQTGFVAHLFLSPFIGIVVGALHLAIRRLKDNHSSGAIGVMRCEKDGPGDGSDGAR